MTQLDKLETSLNEALNKKAPFKLPEDNRKSLAHALWWLALVGGLLQLYLAWRLWDSLHRVNEVIDYINAYAASYGVKSPDNDLGFAFYLVLVTLLVSGVLLLLAAPGLKAMKKAGWDLVFYSLLVNLVYGVIVLFTDYGNLGNLFGAALGSLVGAYLLFQVRDHFIKSHVPAHKK
jgi:amino acid transporter